MKFARAIDVQIQIARMAVLEHIQIHTLGAAFTATGIHFLTANIYLFLLKHE